ncbi:MAG TPA: TolC family protein [Flavitalea sp.]|nr:TolC family protein [Flavitalea sp.]
MKYSFLLWCWFSAVTVSAQPRTLQDFIDTAKLRSPLLRGYEAQILQLRIDSAILQATLRPQVAFISNNMYAPIVKGYGYDEAITNKAQLSGMLQVSRTFLQSGAIAAQFRTLSLQTQTLRDTMQLSVRDFVRTITDQYITAYGDLLTVNYSRDLYELLKKEEVALKKLTQSNIIKQTEYLAFTVTLQQQELTYLQAQIQYNADYLALNYLAGIVDTAIASLAEPQLGDSIPHDFYSSAFYHRYVTDSLRIQNERKLVNYSYRPQVGAFADGGYNSTLQNTPYKNLGFSVGVNLRIPIYDGGQKKLRYQRLDIDEQNRIYNRDFFVAQYQQQIGALTRQLQSTELLFQKIKTQVDYTKTLIQAYGKLLQTGDVKISEVIIAITNFVNSQNTYRQTAISRLRIQSQINYYNQ